VNVMSKKKNAVLAIIIILIIMAIIYIFLRLGWIMR
jgi:hypothetical protein